MSVLVLLLLGGLLALYLAPTVHLGTLGRQIRDKHGNHGILFFLDIKQLDQTMPEKLFEIPFLLQNFLNMSFTHKKPVVLNNEHGSLHPAGICINFYLSLVDISQNGILLRQVVVPPHSPDICHQLSRVGAVTNPLAVQKYFV